MKSSVLLGLACWFLCGIGAGFSAMPEVVNPKTYRSPSGRYELEVDPTDLYARGEGRCRLTERGQEVWAKTLPFTFFNARVSEDGVVAGYGYTEGLEGWSRNENKDRGEFHLAILDAKGNFRLDEKKPRTNSLVIHGGPVPTAGEMLLHPGQDRFAVGIDDGAESYWQAYELSTGKKGKRFELLPVEPEVSHVDHLLKAAAVAGTPLTLAQWWCFDNSTGKEGALFTLHDLAGRELWRLARVDDYSPPGDKEAVHHLHVRLHQEGAIVDADQPGMFELWLVREKQRAIFTVERDGEGWKVKQIGQRPYDPPEVLVPAPNVPEKPLAVLGSFKVGDAPAANVLGTILDWAFDAQGRVGVLHSTDTSETFTLFDEAGQKLAEVPVAAADRANRLAWLQDARWVLTGEGGEKGGTRAWWLEATQKTLRAAKDFSCPEIGAMARTGDGGFVVFTTEWKKRLIAFDGQGRQRWERTETLGDEAGELRSPSALTVTKDGEVAVQDALPTVIKFYDLKGAYLRTFDLEKSLGRSLHYISSLGSDPAGGLCICEDSGARPFLRIKGDHTAQEFFRPKLADGRVANFDGGLRIAPGGQVWISDRLAIYRLAENRVADLTIGAAPDMEKLRDLDANDAEADATGHLFIADSRSGAVHVYDAEGHKVRVSKPDKDDFANCPSITVSPDGTLFMFGDLPEPPLLARIAAADASLAPPERHRHTIQFDPDGARVEAAALPAYARNFRNWLPRVHGFGPLIVEEHSVSLADAAGKVTRTISRRADHRWFGDPGIPSAAPDGSFAIASSTGNYLTDALTFFSPDGDPEITVPLPETESGLRGYNGQYAILRDGKKCWLYNRQGKPLSRFSLDMDEQSSMHTFLTCNGRELWAFDSTKQKVTRYAMPEK